VDIELWGSLQTKLQTNHAAQNGIRDHRAKFQGKIGRRPILPPRRTDPPFAKRRGELKESRKPTGDEVADA